jgi:nucleotide-binding universal stress UspA family protein
MKASERATLMISLKKILVPVDFSEPSKKAVTYGLTLAGSFSASLILAHIVPESSALLYSIPTQFLEIEKQQYVKAAAEIRHLVPSENASRLSLQTIVKIGIIEEELLRIVRDEGIDLVVMGTHGRQRLSRWFMGSVTEHLLRHVPVPVLTVSHVEAERLDIGLVTLNRILYATDLSESSSAGLEHAAELARGAGAQLTVLHVVDTEDRMLWGPAVLARLDRPQLLAELRQKLDDVLKQQKAAGVETEALLVEGKPFRKIVEIADERGMDIVVLNLQSKSLFERAFLGSTAERVVRLARTPVLSVPAAASNDPRGNRNQVQ